MNVKLQIKEVKEEWKPVCTGMRCIIHITENCLWSIVNGDDVETAYKDSGYVINTIRYKDDTHCEGLFRTETIRDATPKEIIAWHCLESYKECVKVDSNCYACPLNVTDGICIPRNCDGIRANLLLRGKEVIVSLTEESI